MRVYYNEIEPFAVAWLKQLIMFRAIPDGDIDTRPIQQIDGWELGGYDQCHFFAGIGGWAHALELAQWEGPVWTGSCPCQPFSVAGQGRGEADERHLWPYFHRLIAECSPPSVFGEQVASALGRGWLSRVRADLEALGYAVGAADLCAAGESAPHIRQRLYWMGAKSESQQQHGCGHARGRRREFTNASPVGGVGIPDAVCAERGQAAEGWDEHDRRDAGRQETPSRSAPCGETSCGLQLAEGDGWQQCLAEPERRRAVERCAASGRVADTTSDRATRTERCESGAGRSCGVEPASRGATGRLGNNNTGSQGRSEHVGERGDQRAPWAAGVFVPCLDGKARRVEPGIFPLADGFPNRVGTLRGSGNAIVPALAATFIEAYKETQE